MAMVRVARSAIDAQASTTEFPKLCGQNATMRIDTDGDATASSKEDVRGGNGVAVGQSQRTDPVPLINQTSEIAFASTFIRLLVMQEIAGAGLTGAVSGVAFF